MGSQTSTHVANDYTHPICVMCDSERKHVTEFKGNLDLKLPKVTLGANAEKHIKTDINSLKTGFTKIMPGNAVRFDVDCKGTQTVYITIYAEDDNPEPICEGLQKKEDFSVMVTKDRQVLDVEYGTVWKPVSKVLKK